MAEKLPCGTKESPEGAPRVLVVELGRELDGVAVDVQAGREAEIVDRVDVAHGAREQVNLAGLIRALPSNGATTQRPPNGSMLTVG